MRKFKLRKWYPSLPENLLVGQIVRIINNYYYTIGGDAIATRDEIENNPEFWEEVIERKPLFVTEDDVEVFQWDTVYYVLPSFELRSYEPTISERHEKCHYFSSRDKANEYIKLNSPRYSLNDLMEMVGDIYAHIPCFEPSLVFKGILLENIEKLKEDVLSEK